MAINLHVGENEEEALNLASAIFKATLKRANNETKKVLLALSGGSALSLLNLISREDLGENITITVLDERWSSDPTVNNFSQIKASKFYKEATSSGSSFIETIPQSSETRDELAMRFNQSISTWFSENPNGLVIATVGIGEDGHTSGMMPFPENKDKFNTLFNNENIFVVGYDATGKNPYPDRVTTNMNFMRRINTAIVYAIGEKKRESLLKLFAEKGDLASTPARILKEMKNVQLFTDILL